MASTSFSLAGRQHPSVAENIVNSTKVVEPEPVLAVEQIAEPEPDPVIKQEPVLAVEQITEPDPVIEPEPVLATWNANWSRTKLFEAASLLNLKVSVTSSKNDIIAALKAATA
jgi:hypothetical protein